VDGGDRGDDDGEEVQDSGIKPHSMVRSSARRQFAGAFDALSPSRADPEGIFCRCGWVESLSSFFDFIKCISNYHA
jgi:hypothetical protein